MTLDSQINKQGPLAIALKKILYLDKKQKANNPRMPNLSPLWETFWSNLRLVSFPWIKIWFKQILGEGAYSIVYKVTRKSDGKSYALKQVNKTLKSS